MSVTSKHTRIMRVSVLRARVANYFLVKLQSLALMLRTGQKDAVHVVRAVVSMAS